MRSTDIEDAYMTKPQGPPTAPKGNQWEDEDGPWRHPPVAPKDAGIADSLGKSVSDVVTGPLEGDPSKAVEPKQKPAGKP